jgi:hypothetical protein
VKAGVEIPSSTIFASLSITTTSPNGVGGPDPAFGNGTGMVEYSISQTRITTVDITATPDASGTLTSVGYDEANNKLLISQIGSDGLPIPSFGTNGYIRIPLPNGFVTRRVQVQRDATTINPSLNAYVLGYNSANGAAVVLRYFATGQSAGQPDARFGNSVPALDGRMELRDLGPNAQLDCITAYDKERAFLLGGNIDGQAFVKKITDIGNPVPTFGNSGSGTFIRQTTDSSIAESITSLAITPKGLIYAAGSSGTADSTSLMTLRLTSTGKPDSSFAPPLFQFPDYKITLGQKVEVGADDRVVVTAAIARVEDARDSRYGLGLVRYLNGLLDPTLARVGYKVVLPPLAPAGSTGTLVTSALRALRAARPKIKFIAPVSSALLASDLTDIQKEKNQGIAATALGGSTDIRGSRNITQGYDFEVLGFNLSTSGRPVKVNASVTGTYTLANFGTLKAVNLKVPYAIFLDPDVSGTSQSSPASSDFIRISVKAYPEPGYKSTVSPPVKLTANRAPGSYYVRALINVGTDQIPEAKTDNNANPSTASRISIVAAKGSNTAAPATYLATPALLVGRGTEQWRDLLSGVLGVFSTQLVEQTKRDEETQPR